MIDIKYFLEEEDNYNKTNHDEWTTNEFGELEFAHDALSFLREKPFHKLCAATDFVTERCTQFGLTDSERTVLRMFYAKWSAEFRDDFYKKPIPELANNMFITLNNVIKKAPITDSKVLYRFCNEYDQANMKINDVILIPHNLTCTTFNWNQNGNNVYVICTLPSDKTCAHDLYKIYEHGDEKQVNFLRGTRFLVTKIEEIPNTKYHTYYLDELAL